jgi:hypothetical protein
MRTTLIAICLFLLSIPVFAQDNTNAIAASVNSGNAKEISKFFNDDVDMKIIDKEDVYSKAQAELILKDFFAKHPVKSFSLAHKSAPNAKNGSQYVIGTLDTGNGKFRTYFLLKTAGGRQLIQQFRIEADNE